MVRILVHIRDFWQSSVYFTYAQLTWQYFDLHVEVNKTDWIGKANMTYNGPVFAVTFGW
jgi:hypothetical protein